MEPFVKWAGGKRQLLNQLLDRLPINFNRYVEPFVGGGALFFALQADQNNPKRINDTNKQLINCYQQIKNNVDSLIIALNLLRDQHNSDVETAGSAHHFFYEIRDAFNARIAAKNLNVNDAAMFIYLNKTCFNGLYRVNASGRFNVPYGKKRRISLYSESNILQCSKALEQTDILSGDFEVACRYLRKGDFVFFDSPYHETFDSYDSGRFSEADHLRLARLFQRLHERGIYCMLTNNDTEYIRHLYRGFRIEEVPVKRLISCDAQRRVGTELIITSNYEFSRRELWPEKRRLYPSFGTKSLSI